MALINHNEGPIMKTISGGSVRYFIMSGEGERQINKLGWIEILPKLFPTAPLPSFPSVWAIYSSYNVRITTRDSLVV